MFCGHVSLCIMYIQFPLRPEEVIRSPRTGFTDGCELLGIESRSSRRAARPLTHWAIFPALSWAFLAFKRIVLGVYSCFLSHFSSLFLVSRFLCRKQGYTKTIAGNVCVESEWSEKFVNNNWILEKLEGKSRNPGLFSGFFAGWWSCWTFLGWCSCFSVYWLKFHEAWVSPWNLLENTHCTRLFFPPLSSCDFVAHSSELKCFLLAQTFYLVTEIKMIDSLRPLAT